MYLINLIFCKKKFIPNIGQNKQKWQNGGLEPGGLYLQNPKIRVCYYKTKLLTVITYPPTIKINPDNNVYANVSDPPPSPLY